MSAKGAPEARTPSSACSRGGTTSSASERGTSTIASSRPSACLTLEDAETGEVVEIDTGSARQRARLAEAVEKTEESIRALARSAHVDLLEVDTLKPYLGPLIGFFKSRGVRS